MREIIFEYIYSDGKDFLKKSFTLNEISNGDCDEFINDMPFYKNYKLITRRQGTGLKDKNGKEIYEGDILSGLLGGKGEVFYREDMGLYEVRGIGGIFEVNTKDFEIVGNIFENPELIS